MTLHYIDMFKIYILYNSKTFAIFLFSVKYLKAMFIQMTVCITCTLCVCLWVPVFNYWKRTRDVPLLLNPVIYMFWAYLLFYKMFQFFYYDLLTRIFTLYSLKKPFTLQVYLSDWGFKLRDKCLFHESKKFHSS